MTCPFLPCSVCGTGRCLAVLDMPLPRHLYPSSLPGLQDKAWKQIHSLWHSCSCEGWPLHTALCSKNVFAWFSKGSKKCCRKSGEVKPSVAHAAWAHAPTAGQWSRSQDLCRTSFPPCSSTKAAHQCGKCPCPAEVALCASQAVHMKRWVSTWLCTRDTVLVRSELRFPLHAKHIQYFCRPCYCFALCWQSSPL